MNGRRWMDRYRPVQIVPALPGWRAVYREKNGDLVEEPVLFWAVCQLRTEYYDDRGLIFRTERHDNTFEAVVEMYEGLSIAATIGDFCGLCGPGKTLEAFRAEQGPAASNEPRAMTSGKHSLPAAKEAQP